MGLLTRIVRAALRRVDEDGMPSLPPGARAAEFEAVAEAAVVHGVTSLDRMSAVMDWLGRAKSASRPRRPRAAAAAGGSGAAAGAGGSDEDEGEDDDDDSGMGFDSGEDWLDDENEWSGDEEEKEEDHLVSSSTDDEDDDEDDG
ncbi:hypothetical protein MNEG_15344 [Monoraphidium neglectum]|uniref:Uncharacterized protein n=1 Tax=Monoraphidium neglectum TaxID=145388 RepID=A0A0D2K959_9CHLO|nr:hypothetical protein MNEG_15344 [Monoraphidium neglectum]KIY92618.1 hypothetical protein MNEG_15344 [Monoraphidium neglectum]|eukprot:XP_013891638.1 hypothetical protein MNEG_15344 [Monoraphidium neglectum]